ncbi:MAG: serine/threonine-protein kinase PknK, partial [Chitinophagales bacterium]
MTEQLIHESKKSKIYFQDESEYGKPVLLKILNYEFPTPYEISQFYNEYDIIKELNIPGIRKVYQQAKAKNHHAIYLEWVDAKTVREVFSDKKGNVIAFLQAAIAIAAAIGEMHLQHIIHKDINPDNVLIDPEKHLVKLIDFGISSKIDLKQHHLGNPERLEGTLAYNSPEQTGRMNRVVDYRTDLYSMGVMFYEMLAGQLPFLSEDAMELVHCHLAVTPIPVDELEPVVPKPVADIIALLLAKNAEDRYQSAFGVKSDLEKCLLAFQTAGTIAPFKLRQTDFSGKFQIPQKLFGRDEQIEKLIEAFNRCAKGKLEMLLVSGYSGTGKSALIHEVHKPITQKRGYFIEGKFDQFQRAVPYYAFLQAFKEFVNFLLTDQEDKLVRYRNDIQEAVGKEGKVLTDVIPNLEFVIGPQPNVPEIGATESQNRFNYVFGKFVNAISKADHPVVLFIDDLQWADSASLSLLKILMSDADNGYLLFIGAYRSNEVSDAHPFIITLNELEENRVAVGAISIDNLSMRMVNDLIAEAVGSERENAIQLTKLVYAKTQGNPFFVIQFLKSLYENGLLQFNFEKHLWSWDLKKIEEQNITDNVVTLMAAKILKLQPVTQQALKLAACIGFGFDLEKLSVIYEKNVQQTQQDLDTAMMEGLIIPSGDLAKFSHDRIQQAVYSLIPDDEKNALHLRIGRLLLRNFNSNELEEHLFDVVTQLNHGIELIKEEDEKEQVAKLNFNAGIKAKQTYAFKQAMEYLESGIALLKPDHWQSQYELSKNLYTAAAESAYLNSDFNAMDRHLAQVIHPDRKLLDQVAAYEIRIQALIAQNQLNNALDVGLDILNKLGVHFPAHPNDVNVILGLVNTKMKLLGKSFEQLEHLPNLEDEMDLARMRLCTEITP